MNSWQHRFAQIFPGPALTKWQYSIVSLVLVLILIDGGVAIWGLMGTFAEIKRMWGVAPMCASVVFFPITGLIGSPVVGWLSGNWFPALYVYGSMIALWPIGMILQLACRDKSEA